MDRKKLFEISKKYLIPAALCIAFFCLAFTSIKFNSVTSDEPSHLDRGIMLLKTGDFRLNQHHPWLYNTIHAIPLLFNKSYKNPDLKSVNWTQARRDSSWIEMVTINGGYSKYTRDILYAPRVLALILTTLFVVVYYYILKKIFGFGVAIASTLLLALSPTVLAHSYLITTDVPSMVTIFLATVALYFYLKNDNKTSRRRRILFWIFILASVAALITKFTTIFASVVWVALIFMKSWQCNRGISGFKRFIKSLWLPVQVILLWILALFALYGFQFGTMHQMSYGFSESIKFDHELVGFLSARINSQVWRDLVWNLYNKVPFPFPQYVRGFIENVLWHNERGHMSYLLGHWAMKQDALYFPVAFAVKEQLFTVLIFVAALFWGIVKVIKKAKNIVPEMVQFGVFFNKISKKIRSLKLENLALVLVPAFLLFITTFSSMDLGVRYLLPAYPFIFILCGIFIMKLVKLWKYSIYTVAVIFIIMLANVIRADPYFIEYFNEFAGGPANGYKFLQDSNLDWGQNTDLVQKYIDSHKSMNAHSDLNSIHGKGLWVVRIWDVTKPDNVRTQLETHYYEEYKSGSFKPVDQIGYTHWVFEVNVQ